VSDLAHWDCWAWAGDRTVSRPEPNTTPEAAMALLLAKVRLVFGEQDWPAWAWDAREYASGSRTPRRLRFRYEGGSFVALAPADAKMAG
jgi:hypothetical protein